MEAVCVHDEEEDEKFLLDDENTFTTKCSVCTRSSVAKMTENNLWEVNNSHTIRDGTHLRFANGADMDDHVDTLEDSPLLINDFRNNDEFHCHNLLVQTVDQRAWQKLLIASMLCFFFMVTEFLGGFIAGSLAIMTDAAHLFSDFIGFLISLLSIWIARKSPNKSMTFGYYRAEVLGAFLSVLTIWLLAAVFAVLAINRIWKKEYDIDANTMMLVASLGLVINIVIGGVLHGCCHNHSHGLIHSHQVDANSNINVRAAAAHVLGDILQSVGVLISAIIIKAFPNAKMADPVCTLIFCIVVIVTTARVAKDSIWLLLEGSPKDTGELALELQNIANVRHLHNLHVWTLSPGRDAASVHLCVDKYCDRDLILEKATSLINSRLNLVSCTIQIETYSSELINSCTYCQAPAC